MSTVSYDIDEYYNESFLKDLVEICLIPDRLIREARFFFSSLKAKRKVKKIIKFNHKLMESLLSMDYFEVLQFEKKVINFLESTTRLIKECTNCPEISCKERLLKPYFFPLKSSFESLLIAMRETYHINANEVFETDEEYKQNNEALKAFADIWDYDTPEEDKQLIFKYNADLKSV